MCNKNYGRGQNFERESREGNRGIKSKKEYYMM